MRERLDLAASGGIVLPGGEVVSVSRLRSLGMLLGTNDGWQTLYGLLETDPRSNAFRYDLARALPFSARNPLYFLFHESSYADGHATRWSADRVEPDDFLADPTLLTGEHVNQRVSVGPATSAPAARSRSATPTRSTSPAANDAEAVPRAGAPCVIKMS
ncbi:hypothetical protein PFZ49_09755 [Microbacterium lacticum]|uniref:hypothetical protein n=1 Tax=Microbacterium lacticum TaxID=33885 RepID=UPI003A846503